MMRLAIGMFSMTLAASISHAEVEGPSPFGKTPDGEAQVYTLKNASGAYAKISTLGATIVDIGVPDKDGKIGSVVLGFDSAEGYLSDANQYFGCTTGRYANRIAKGKFKIDGKEYQVATNNGPNHLHGGVKRSLDKVLWKAKVLEKQPPALNLTYSSPDGEEGYPGNLEIKVTFAWTDHNALAIRYIATTDKATPVNLTNHSYFNLSGPGSKTVLDHRLMVNADKYIPTDDTMIPTGEIKSVEGTSLDLRKEKRLGDGVDELAKTPNLGYDHTLVLKQPERGKSSLAATLSDPASGRTLTVFTDQPGIQVYSGNFLKGQKGAGAKTYPLRSAVCLETHLAPDAVNQPNLGNSILRPGETYVHFCVYDFRVKK
ncbi:MAG: galactose mutarotase [Gemmataceae bacterium]|nr:galactose mutarotase [Gemmataceae bacterium]